MNAPPVESIAQRTNRLFFGTVFGLLSAVGYTCANIFLRSVADCDAIWVAAVKAFPLVVLAGSWLVVQRVQRQAALPARRALLLLVLAGLVGQLGGNVLFQFSLGVVGMALSVPLCLGTLILSGALLGRIFLGEPLSARNLMAVAILVLAIAVLSLGAGEAQRAVAATVDAAWPASWWHLAAGVVAASLSGFAYSVLGVVIRYGIQGRVSLPATMFTIGVVGVCSLGGVTLGRLGWDQMWATPPDDAVRMLMAGLFNAAAFWALTKALQVVNVVYVNALNATQVTLAALAGMVFFREALSGQLVLGVGLTIIGVMLMRRSQ